MPARARLVRPDWIPRLTLRGGTFLAAGGALFLNALVVNRRDLLFVACLLMAVPLVALASVAGRLARVQVTRRFRPPVLPAGDEAVVSLHLRNLSARPIRDTHWRDTASPGINLPAGAPLPGLGRFEGGRAGADTARIDYTITPRLRGVYDVGPLVLARRDPFGLAYSERAVGEPHELVVTPRLTLLPGTGLSITSGDGSIHEPRRHLGPHTDELIAREYRPGDPLRRVNWPATARRGEIMVRQEEQRGNPVALIILDTTLGGGPAGAAPLGRAFELAIELAASVGVHLLEAGYRLEVVELGEGQLAPGADRDRGGPRIDAPVCFRAPGGDRLLLEALAGVVPVGHVASGDPGRDTPRPPVHGPGVRVPAFAVLVDGDERDAAALAVLRGRCEPAVAFVPATVNRAAADRLRANGWLCVRLRGPRDIGRAWEQAQHEQGAVHDPA